MTSIIITAPFEVDDLVVSILDAGAFQYPWYKVFTEHEGEEQVFTVAIQADDDESIVARVITEQVLADTVGKIVTNRLPGWETVLHGALHDDFDSISADIVLQYAVLGDLVWG